MKAARDSNFELLRILAMAMIIFHHIMVHCFYPQLTDNSLISELNNGVFNYPVFFRRLLLTETLVPLGKTGVNIFIVLSGYFTLENGHNISLRKSAEKLLSQIGFATVLLMIFSLLYYIVKRENSVPLMNLSLFNAGWWFAGYYYIIIAFGTLFLKDFLNGMSKDKYLTFILFLFAIISFGWTGAILDNIGSGLRAFCTGICCYTWGGGYVRKFNPFSHLKTPAIFFVILTCFILMWFSYYNATINNINKYLRDAPDTPFLQASGTNAYSEYAIIPITLGVLIFELFRRIRIQQSKAINIVAKSTFTTYLIHDNDFIREYWKHHVDLVSLLHESVLKFSIAIILRTIAVFIIGFLAFNFI